MYTLYMYTIHIVQNLYKFTHIYKCYCTYIYSTYTILYYTINIICYASKPMFGPKSKTCMVTLRI